MAGHSQSGVPDDTVDISLQFQQIHNGNDPPGRGNRGIRAPLVSHGHSMGIQASAGSSAVR